MMAASVIAAAAVLGAVLLWPQWCRRGDSGAGIQCHSATAADNNGTINHKCLAMVPHVVLAKGWHHSTEGGMAVTAFAVICGAGVMAN